MARKIKSGLIQMSLPKTEGEGTVQEIKDAMVEKHIPFIEEAGKKERSRIFRSIIKSLLNKKPFHAGMAFFFEG